MLQGHRTIGAVIVVLVVLVLAGCGSDDAALLREAEQHLTWWQVATAVGTFLALLIGIAVGSRGRP